MAVSIRAKTKFLRKNYLSSHSGPGPGAPVSNSSKKGKGKRSGVERKRGEGSAAKLTKILRLEGTGRYVTPLGNWEGVTPTT